MSTALVAMVTKVGRNRATLLLRYTFAEFFFFFLTWTAQSVYFVQHVDETRMVIKKERPDTSVAAWVCDAGQHFCLSRDDELLVPSEWARGQLQTGWASHLYQWSVWEEERNGEESLFILVMVLVFSSVLPTITWEEDVLWFRSKPGVCVCVLVPVSLFLIFFCASHPSRPVILHFGFFSPKDPGCTTQFGCWWILKSHRSSWDPWDPITPERGWTDEMSAWQHLVFPHWSVYSASVSLSCGHVEDFHWCCRLKLFGSQILWLMFKWCTFKAKHVIIFQSAT